VKKRTNFFAAIVCFFVIVMVGITFLLINEYIFFKKEKERLLILKEDYNNYALALKKMILDYENHEQESQDTYSEQKKKPLNEPISLLNRETAYLKESALVFARQYKLENDLRRLYEHDETKNQSYHQYRKQWRRSTTQVRKVQKPVLKKTFQEWQEYAHEVNLIWPIERDLFWLSSPFGPRKQPNGSWGFHYGIDMAALRGTMVKASAQGIVIEAGFAPGYGNTIVLAHGKKCRTRYAHLAKILVTIGDKVGQGELIGKVGDTGNARKRGKDASHLHFEVSLLGKKVNPLYFLT
jgi:murein DD-endopeptidase MepM/ murein hydrolase activator NlpD